jgi:hypothetical protein
LKPFDVVDRFGESSAVLMPRVVFGQEDRDRYTLRQVAELRLVFVFECRNCRKVSEVDVLGLIERYGASVTVGEIRDKARWVPHLQETDG